MDLLIPLNKQEGRIKELIYHVMENYPEASLCLFCRAWNYRDCEYTFVDEEDEKVYKIGYTELRKGFTKLIGLAISDEFRTSGWSPAAINADDWEDWECDWDALVVDALVQCAIFGDVIYG